MKPLHNTTTYTEQKARTALIWSQTSAPQTEHFQDSGDGKYEHLQGVKQH